MEPLFLNRQTSSDIECSSFSKEVVRRYVDLYDRADFQNGLARLYADRASMDSEEWAKQLYIAFRNEPLNPRYMLLNEDRKRSLALLYALVDEQKRHDFPSGDFENAILKVFKVRRLKRILGICVIMDKCQSLYKMELEGMVGMHWFCDLHVDPVYSLLSREDSNYWNDVLFDYPGKGTMNKRLYFLLNSTILNLKDDPMLFKWSLPEVAKPLERGI